MEYEDTITRCHSGVCDLESLNTEYVVNTVIVKSFSDKKSNIVIR